MRYAHLAIVGGLAFGCAFALAAAPSAMSGAHGPSTTLGAGAGPARVPSNPPGSRDTAAGPRGVIVQYCLECHDNDKQKGDLTLETFDPSKPELRADVA